MPLVAAVLEDAAGQQLLNCRERGLLRCLSVFAGGWTAAAARAVALPEATEAEVLRLLDGLEAKGLIVGMPRGEPQRWTFLQTVAEYAAEQLEADRGEDLVRERHVRWMTAFAAEADRLLLEPGGLELVDHETPNLRVALEWAIQHDPGAALTLVASLIRHWIMAEHFAEGSTSTAAALSVAGEGDVGPRAVVHCAAGVIGTL